ncbi:MAG: hypothetical protein SVV03_05675 [Candidatus Nanohaloarchaea archaeon]|nr:hypothetical protein [Candidatus Nanohaloarchaea archaeon]
MHYLIPIIMSLLALYAFQLSWRILEEMEDRGRKSQVALGFHTREILEDFNTFYYSGLLLLTGFIWFFLGALNGVENIQTVGELIVLTFFLFPIVVLNRWKERLVK